MKYIKRVTVEYNTYTKEWDVVIYFGTGQVLMQSFGLPTEALKYAERAFENEADLDQIPF